MWLKIKKKQNSWGDTFCYWTFVHAWNTLKRTVNRFLFNSQLYLPKPRKPFIVQILIVLNIIKIIKILKKMQINFCTKLIWLVNNNTNHQPLGITLLFPKEPSPDVWKNTVILNLTNEYDNMDYTECNRTIWQLQWLLFNSIFKIYNFGF